MKLTKLTALAATTAIRKASSRPMLSPIWKCTPI
jgi:hypothetical protein